MKWAKGCRPWSAANSAFMSIPWKPRNSSTARRHAWWPSCAMSAPAIPSSSITSSAPMKCCSTWLLPGRTAEQRHPIFVRTPVTVPQANYAVHKIPDIDAMTENSVMCVMLRAALLPSMIVAKEIQEYSSRHTVPPFALFKISRDDSRSENDMAYVLDLKRSYFHIDELQGRDLFFADPMNATGGSLVTVIQYLRDQGIRPRSIGFFNVVSTLKGALRIVRAVPEAEVFTLWMDPALNREGLYPARPGRCRRPHQRPRPPGKPARHHPADRRLRHARDLALPRPDPPDRESRAQPLRHAHETLPAKAFADTAGQSVRAFALSENPWAFSPPAPSPDF